MANNNQPKGKVLVLDEHRKKQFKKDIRQVFQRYGFDNGFWMCADSNPTTLIGTTVYMGHTNPLAEELRAYAEAISSLMREQAGHDPI